MQVVCSSTQRLARTCILTRRPKQRMPASISMFTFEFCVFASHFTHLISSICRLVERDTGLPSAVPLLRSYAKVETMTIAELNRFIVTATSQVYILYIDLGFNGNSMLIFA